MGIKQENEQALSLDLDDIELFEPTFMNWSSNENSMEVTTLHYFS